ncbi:MAG: Rpn family recombination-promoting nuclease/putative transposase [Leptospirillia bacterium]
MAIIDFTPTPHDYFFKDVFGPGSGHLPALFSLMDPAFAAHVDPASLEFLPGESIGDGLATSTRTDLTASFFVARGTLDGKDSRFVFIFEHKSSFAPLIHFQLLHLVDAAWSRAIREGSDPLPVIPILLYHGPRPWSLPLRLSEVLGIAPGAAPGLPDFELQIIDLSRLSDLTIREKVPDFIPLTALLAMKHVHESLEVFLRVILRTSGEIKPPRVIMEKMIVTVLDYATHVHKEEGTEEILSVFEEVFKEEKMTSVVELFKERGFKEGVQKGIQEGRQKGIQEGRQEELRKNIARLLLKGFSPEEVAGLLDADPNLVLEIAASPPRL